MATSPKNLPTPEVVDATAYAECAQCGVSKTVLTLASVDIGKYGGGLGISRVVYALCGCRGSGEPL